MHKQKVHALWLTQHLVTTVGCMLSIGWAALGAQDARRDTTKSLRGSARAYLAGTANLERRIAVGVSGFLMPFVSERWQLGLAPTYAFTPSSGRYGHSNSLQLAAIANYVVGHADRVVGYLGGYGATSQSWVEAGESPGAHYSNQQIGAQAGVLVFLTPLAAIRTEARYRQWLEGGGAGTFDVIVILDPYLWGASSKGATQSPSLGALDLSFVADSRIQPERVDVIDATVAPFLTRWLQVGTVVQYEHEPRFGFDFHAVDGFGRVYAPLSPRTMPFVGGFVGNSVYANERSGLSNYGWVAGVRQLLNANVALNLAVELRRHSSIDVGDFHFRSPDTYTLQAKLLPHFPARHRR